MNPSPYVLELQPPAVIAVTTPDKTRTVLFDIFEAWRALGQNAKQPTEDKRWETNRRYLAEKFEISIDDISESMAREFNEVIVTLGTKLQDQCAKKVEGMLS